ncbi:hypothetical protein BRC62_01655 [Halobacteriales archaeon QH_10_67_13]|nr:MAG: hypothetical protein BRC62_01655 [Halobacteriales archaeon QH_10_67_13]
MSETSRRVGLSCPACSADRPVGHEVLSEGSGQATVRCTACGHTHKRSLPDERTVSRRVVVSQEGESFTTTTEIPAEEALSVGEEFLIETEKAFVTARITSLELEGGRTESAPAEAVETVWSRAVGNVVVDVTAHPKSGAREGTRSLELRVPGDYEFVVGEADELGGESFTVEGIYVRDDATGYEFDKLGYDGDAALAKDVKRLYVRDESTTAWSAW